MKPAGGIRTAKLALHFLVAVKETLGDAWLTNVRYRFGASALLNDLLRQIEKGTDGRVPGDATRFPRARAGIDRARSRCRLADWRQAEPHVEPAAGKLLATCPAGEHPPPRDGAHAPDDLPALRAAVGVALDHLTAGQGQRVAARLIGDPQFRACRAPLRPVGRETAARP